VYRGSANGSIGVATTHKHSLKPNEVLLQITHSSICGTDAHFAAFMPLVLGHEGVGIVKEIALMFGHSTSGIELVSDI
jgi:D-arabinose 1-dehydrogenase-like Zn-dependent alcohol dehydrogenase